MEALAAILVELQKAERQGERHSHPGCMLQTAVSLTYCNVYPHWLVQEVFGDLTQKVFQGLHGPREVIRCTVSYSRPEKSSTGGLKKKGRPGCDAYLNRIKTETFLK